MKKIFSIIAGFVFLCAFMVPLPARAQVPPLMPFGGYSTFIWPCTCNFAVWAWFVPLYLSAVPVTGPLTYVPYATLPFANYLLSIPSVPHVGAYIPGVQACWEYIGYSCIPIPSIGVMGFAGTGL